MTGLQELHVILYGLMLSDINGEGIRTLHFFSGCNGHIFIHNKVFYIGTGLYDGILH